MNFPLVVADVTWHKSSYSNAGGNCVEVGRGAPGVVPFRDSKVEGGPVVAVGTATWSAFVGGVRAQAPAGA
ncbi:MULTISPECIES: DUF397 domain-containing protein [Streptomyces]|uniref:DUF397 domain-containing protein n=1 Tax=Streptomyces odorifer TaxID=53450 RepID=A0A7Y6CB25_9ACTN|nr:DUF397 domain-containing protein [Streptomyces odorifer]NUV30317.1 DUF397 domain-containing protein [Streptomyces odorifer]NUV37165.1 DUF397 domain-containing protein [Streptomyces sp. KAI-27]NUV49446.1 DUF397 domain-containing protein [Streptomyces sp. CAI-78]